MCNIFCLLVLKKKKKKVHIISNRSWTLRDRNTWDMTFLVVPSFPASFNTSVSDGSACLCLCGFGLSVWFYYITVINDVPQGRLSCRHTYILIDACVWCVCVRTPTDSTSAQLKKARLGNILKLTAELIVFLRFHWILLADTRDVRLNLVCVCVYVCTKRGLVCLCECLWERSYCASCPWKADRSDNLFKKSCPCNLTALFYSMRQLSLVPSLVPCPPSLPHSSSNIHLLHISQSRRTFMAEKEIQRI